MTYLTKSLASLSQAKLKSFLWQHFLLLCSLYLMTLGVVLCIKSFLGSSVISSLPLVLSLAGEVNLTPALTVGGYTIAMNFFLVFCQILVLRRQFDPMQLFQLIIGFVFGWLIDINAMILSPIECDTLTAQILAQFAGCTIMGIGIAFEVKCGSVTMPGEGISIAISQETRRPFPKVKIMVDIILVVLAVIACYCFFGEWKWNVIGPGTLFAMLYVGIVVKFVSAHIGWFDRLLEAKLGIWKYMVGLVRYIRGK